MEQAWSEFVAARQDDLDKNWYQEYGENDGDWVGDWGKEQKAWDRYAHSESKVSMNKLQQQQQSDKEKIQTEKKEEEHAEQKEKNNRKKDEKNQKKDEGRSKKRKKVSEGQQTMDENQYVPDITDYIKDMLTKVKKDTPETLKQKHKDELRLQTPNSAECRLGVYWKRPGVGVALRSSRQDICYFSTPPIRDGDYLIRLSASLKAASMLVT